MSDAVLFADEEKAGPASVPVAESAVVVGAKKEEEFRNYKNSKRQATVEEFYRLQHENQTYDFVCAMEKKYLSLNHFEMSIWDCLLFLDKVNQSDNQTAGTCHLSPFAHPHIAYLPSLSVQLVDDSDPDTQNSQLQHALQTAESARRLHPTLDWFHVTALIHDLGKILSMACNEPQWAVVGDTFPVGCAFDKSNVFPQSFAANPDSAHGVYGSELGVYSEGCGLRNVKMSWGHDSYLAEVCLRNHTSLPAEALAMIRYHSFYPWHKHGAYKQLTDQEDEKMLYWVLEFNKCDLYSKDAPLVDVEAVKPYYLSLIAKYFPATLKW